MADSTMRDGSLSACEKQNKKLKRVLRKLIDTVEHDFNYSEISQRVEDAVDNAVACLREVQ